MDTKLLSAPKSNKTLARCWFRRNVPVTTFGSWLLPVAGPLFLQFLGSSISPEGFLPSILLLVVIIVAVVIVVVTVVLVVVFGEGASRGRSSIVIIKYRSSSYVPQIASYMKLAPIKYLSGNTKDGGKKVGGSIETGGSGIGDPITSSIIMLADYSLTDHRERLLPQVGALLNTQSSSNEMRSLAMYVLEPERGSSVLIDYSRHSKLSRQIFLDNQLEGMINHNRIYIAPSHTKKVFANMKRQGKDFSGRVTPLFSTMMVQAQQEQGEGSDMPTDPHHTPTIIPPSTSQPQRKQRPRKPKRKDTEIPQSSVPVENVADEAVYEERDDSLERATTTATGLDAEQDRGVNTPQSGEDSLQLKELMEFCTKLQQRVLDLENTKTAQAHEITSLKKRVKKLERKKKLRTHSLKRLYKVGLSARIDSSDDEATLGDQEDASKQGRKIHDIDADNDIILDSTHFDTDPDMFGMLDLDSDEVFVETKEPVVNAATTTQLKSTKPKAVRTAATTTITAVTRPKAKGLDKVETDYELAQRLQVEEQEELTIEEKSKLFHELLEKRRKHFAAKRAEERRNRPPTKAQPRSIMCTYLKNMAGWKPKDLKTNKTREESSSKRAGDELEQEPLKKQKVDDDKETEELKQFSAAGTKVTTVGVES
ncbi:hypothetical protein Tco_1121992 [Tanacetum coccineum]|uniref:Uncharacterized protein n=1 Tax=Tanacetum coccineum TaxID=301880 RepID=A0ABQ5IZA0_9ASTR